MGDNILSTPRTVTITLDKEYTSRPLDLNLLADIEEEFGCGIGELQAVFNKRTSSATRKLLYVVLKNNKDLTLEKVGQLVPLSKLGEIMTQITGWLSESMK